MSTPKRKPLDFSYSTYQPDYYPTEQRKKGIRERSQRDQEKYLKSNIQPSKYSVIQPETISNNSNSMLNNLKLNLHSQTQQIYQKMSDLYLNRQAKLKLKNQQRQIKESIYKRKKENLLKKSYMNLISLKQNQAIRDKNPFQSSKFVFEEFDSFRQK